MQNYEIEIKSLLGSRKKADELKNRLNKLFPSIKTLGLHGQRNHYFNEPKDLFVIERIICTLISTKKQKELLKLTAKIKSDISIRTRDADGKVLFIIKASIGDDSSANGVSRIEFEEPVNLSLEALDKKLLNAGLSYQAKWSRERETYNVGGACITIDKNAGYGYLAEFEKIVKDKKNTEPARKELYALMTDLECEELQQSRLERMFKYYNEHWREYYGTDKVFNIK